MFVWCPMCLKFVIWNTYLFIFYRVENFKGTCSLLAKNCPKFEEKYIATLQISPVI